AVVQGQGVAQEVLQLRRLPPAPGLDAGLRWTRRRDPLPCLLRQALRTQGLRLRPCPHPGVHQRRE
ncbi:hypothetical protein KR018_009000, partial [Drosophila ironensis]